jgi:hypothetical protein
MAILRGRGVKNYGWGFLLLLVLLLGASQALAVVVPGQGVPETVLDREQPQVQAVMRTQDRFAPGLMALPGVVGTATGLAADGRPGILVLVESLDAVRGARVPAALEGIPVMVRVTGKIVPLAKGGVPGAPGVSDSSSDQCSADSFGRFPRPAPIGVSTGHPAITAGTIGVRVKGAGNVYALSNNHVYASENQASLGDSVLQPGAYDGGTDPGDAIGILVDFEPIVFSTSASNRMDVAIALTSTGNLDSSTPCNGYGTPRSTTATAAINQSVKKYGRTTGLTNGRITGIHATVNVSYKQGTARFVDQLIIEPGGFSAGGDSGSLIVVDGKGKNKADDRKPVGLLFAGSSQITIASPIDPILERFAVTVDGQ